MDAAEYADRFTHAVAQALRGALAEKGLTPRGVIIEAGLSYGSAKRYFSDSSQRRDLPMDTLVQLCRTANIPVGLVMERADAIVRQSVTEA